MCAMVPAHHLQPLTFSSRMSLPNPGSMKRGLCIRHWSNQIHHRPGCPLLEEWNGPCRQGKVGS